MILRKRQPIKTGSIKWYRQQCNILWSKYIKRNGKCELSKMGECNGALNAAHLIPRSRSKRLMFHPENGVCLCARHHSMLDGKVTGTPLAWQNIEDKYPGKYAGLYQLSKKLEPMHLSDWKENYERLVELTKD